MTTIKKLDWRLHPVEPRIRPLVDGLNSTGHIKTVASCEGHFWRASDPYVFFQCDTAIAEGLAVTLSNLRQLARLSYRWTLDGIFDDQSGLRFRLSCPALDHDNGLTINAWRYLIRRRVIDHDLALLARALPDSVHKGQNIAQRAGEIKPAQIDDQHHSEARNDQHPLPPPLANGVLRPTPGARTSMIRRQRLFANPTGHQAHHCNSPIDRKFGRLIAAPGGTGKC